MGLFYAQSPVISARDGYRIKDKRTYMLHLIGGDNYDMKHELLCMNSDAINKYGFMMHTVALEKSLKQIFDSGIPFLIGHDFHRPLGWTYPFGIFIEPGLSRMLARKLVATNMEELNFFRKELQKFLDKQYHEHFVKYEKAFIPLIESYLTEDQLRIDSGCCAVIENDIATKIFPQLFENTDKNGLVSLEVLLAEFNYLGQGIFQHKNSPLTIYAHHFYRRSQSRFNNFRYFFLDALLSLSDTKDVTIRIRLDRDMIGYGPSFHECGELEFHWGPKYSDDVSQIKPGICLHKSTDVERRFTEISSTEFYWKKDEQEMTFEAEELTDNPSPVSDETFHCRYVHSIYDAEKKEFKHFDGAIRSYNYESMMNRVDKDFVEFGRKAEYTKLFRLDGKIPLAVWKSLVTHYYQGNPMIHEYFGMRDEVSTIGVIEAPLSKYEELVPYDIKKEEGLRLLVSYHPIPDNMKEGRYVDILDVMTNEQGKIYCLEHMVYEVKKMLQSMGEDLGIPDGISLIKIDDGYWNIPSIMHYGNGSEQKLQTTVNALISLFEELTHRGMEKIVSLSIAFILNNRVVRISSYGVMSNQIEWLKRSFPLVHSEEGLTDWVDKQRSYLNRFERNTGSPMIGALTQTDGVLYIKRVPIGFQYEVEPTDTGMEYRLHFPANDESRTLYFEKSIRPALCSEVKKAIWPDSGENYFTSKRSKIYENIPVHIIEAEALALYWTKN